MISLVQRELPFLMFDVSLKTVFERAKNVGYHFHFEQSVGREAERIIKNKEKQKSWNILVLVVSVSDRTKLIYVFCEQK